MTRFTLVACFVLALMPWGADLVAEVVHVAIDGHVADDLCADTCEETGCAPGSHACSCCAPLRVAPSEARAGIPAAGESGTVALPAGGGGERPSFARGICRPPTA